MLTASAGAGTGRMAAKRKKKEINNRDTESSGFIWVFFIRRSKASSSSCRSAHHHRHAPLSATTRTIWIIISAIVILIQPSAVSMVKAVRSGAHTQGLVSSHEYFPLNSGCSNRGRRGQKKVSSRRSKTTWPSMKSRLYRCWFEFILRALRSECQNILRSNANASWWSQLRRPTEIPNACPNMTALSPQRRTENKQMYAVGFVCVRQCFQQAGKFDRPFNCRRGWGLCSLGPPSVGLQPRIRSHSSAAPTWRFYCCSSTRGRTVVEGSRCDTQSIWQKKKKIKNIQQNL